MSCRFEHLFDRRLNEVRVKRAAMEEGRVKEEVEEDLKITMHTHT